MYFYTFTGFFVWGAYYFPIARTLIMPGWTWESQQLRCSSSKPPIAGLGAMLSDVVWRHDGEGDVLWTNRSSVHHDFLKLILWFGLKVYWTVSRKTVGYGVQWWISSDESVWNITFLSGSLLEFAKMVYQDTKPSEETVDKIQMFKNFVKHWGRMFLCESS